MLAVNQSQDEPFAQRSRLLKKSAGSLIMEQLQWAVQYFTRMRFYATPTQLAPDVA